jgi:hypothetical protein
MSMKHTTLTSEYAAFHSMFMRNINKTQQHLRQKTRSMIMGVSVLTNKPEFAAAENPR